MPRAERAAAADARDDARAARLESYRAERQRAQALVITDSMDRRRFGVAPDNCDGGYEVLDR